MTQLKNVCGELDNITLEYFDNVEQLQSCQQQIDDLMKDGFFLLAKVSSFFLPARFLFVLK